MCVRKYLSVRLSKFRAVSVSTKHPFLHEFQSTIVEINSNVFNSRPSRS